MDRLISLVLALAGTLLIIVGMLTILTPIPTGIPLIIIGLVMLMNASRRLRVWILTTSRPYPRLYRFMRMVYKKTAHSLNKTK